jgi:hypothetical protein
MKRVYIAIPIPPRSQWRLLADPDDCPHGYMIIGTMAAVRRPRTAVELQASARPVLALPAPPGDPQPGGLCPACPLRAAAPRPALEVSP